MDHARGLGAQRAPFTPAASLALEVQNKKSLPPPTETPPRQGSSAISGSGTGTCRGWPGDQVGSALVQVLSGVQLPGCTLGQGQL